MAVATPNKQSLTMCVYGESKAGKSLIAISGPAPRVLLDTESSADSLPNNMIDWDPRTPPPQWTPDADWDTAVVTVLDWEDAEQALKQLETRVHQFRTVDLDSVSELQDVLITSITKGAQPKIQDWGTALRQMRGYCKRLRNLTKHKTNPVNAVTVTAMAKLDDKGIWRPWLQGQMGAVIPYIFDVNAYLEVVWVTDPKTKIRSQQRALHIQQTDPQRFVAGGRIMGKLDSPVWIGDISAATDELIIKKNNNFQRMITKVRRKDGPAMASPAGIPIEVAPPATNTEQKVSVNAP